jgi:hypothetical protein
VIARTCNVKQEEDNIVVIMVITVMITTMTIHLRNQSPNWIKNRIRPYQFHILIFLKSLGEMGIFLTRLEDPIPCGVNERES